MVRLCYGIFLRICVLVGCDELSHILLVCRSRVDVELRRICRINAPEGHFLLSAAHIESFLECHWIFLAVNGDDSVASYIDHSKLASVEEMLCLQLVECLEDESLVHRHDSSVDETVIESVGEVDFIRRHHLFHKE